ncbi:MFS transporter [Xanthobacter sp. DSM 24535]|uniref:MFS transporter n=1 Tax=Roseixanthobacter psychrophilus TaxID=3119917 RepID=UPI00372BB517
MKRLNLMVASAVGTTLEWYDFFTFAACAVLVFDKQFFLSSDPFVATLLALSTVSVGFVARPLGGIVFGIAGDRFGRKNVLIASLLLMGAGTFLIGLLPTYATAGIIAPIALVTLRIAQGIAVGGEATGAMLIIAESMPAAQRGLWTSFTMFAGPLANVLTAGVLFIVQAIYGEEAFLDWAWRIPFFVSVLLVILGFWTRRRVEESPAFLEFIEQAGTVERSPLRYALSHNRPEMLKAFFVKASENTFLYIFSTFVLLLATTHLHMGRADALRAVLWASAAEVVVTLIAAHVSDRVGRRPVLLAGFVTAALSSYSLFTLEPGASFGELQALVLLCLSCHGIILGAMAAYMTELFPTRVRYTALSTSYQLASVAGGAVAPLVGAVLLQVTGSAVSVAVYASLVAIPALVSVALSREAKGVEFFSTDTTAVEPEAVDVRNTAGQQA